MKGLREPKKKKKADDLVSTMSLEGSDAYNESVQTNNSNVIDDISMTSFVDNGETGYQSNATQLNSFEHQKINENGDRPSNSISQGVEPQPSTSYFMPDERPTPQQEQQPIRQEKTFQLVQKTNGEHILIDERGMIQPPELYNLIKQPDGSLQVIIHQIVEEVAAEPPFKAPRQPTPQSAPPMIQNGFKQPELPQREPYHTSSVDGTPKKMYDHPPFPPPPPQTNSAGPSTSTGDVTRTHPQLAARLGQPLIPSRNMVRVICFFFLHK